MFQGSFQLDAWCSFWGESKLIRFFSLTKRLLVLSVWASLAEWLTAALCVCCACVFFRVSVCKCGCVCFEAAAECSEAVIQEGRKFVTAHWALRFRDFLLLVCTLFCSSGFGVIECNVLGEIGMESLKFHCWVVNECACAGVCVFLSVGMKQLVDVPDRSDDNKWIICPLPLRQTSRLCGKERDADSGWLPTGVLSQSQRKASHN